MPAREDAGEPAHELAPASPLVAAYLGHIAHERRLSAHTVNNYGRDLRVLQGLAGTAAFETLQTHDIRRFIARLHGKGLDARSLARMLSAWRSFYRYLAREKQLTANPCLGIKPPKAVKRLPAALSPDEANRLMEIRGDDMDAVRDRALLELFYSSGLRLSELTGLAPGDINLDDGTVRVLGKGSKTRIVPVGSRARVALITWIGLRSGMAGTDPDALFVTPKGRRLSPRSVQLLMKRRALEQGLTTDVHPHMLRHSFASHVLQSSGDLRAVQEMLGHASISTTQVYTQLDFQHLAKVYDQAHPRAKKRSK